MGPSVSEEAKARLRASGKRYIVLNQITFLENLKTVQQEPVSQVLRIQKLIF